MPEARKRLPKYFYGRIAAIQMAALSGVRATQSGRKLPFVILQPMTPTAALGPVGRKTRTAVEGRQPPAIAVATPKAGSVQDRPIARRAVPGLPAPRTRRHRDPAAIARQRTSDTTTPAHRRFAPAQRRASSGSAGSPANRDRQTRMNTGIAAHVLCNSCAIRPGKLHKFRE